MAGIVVVGVVCFVLGTLIDIWTSNAHSFWRWVLGGGGTASTITVGIYLRVKQPETFNRFLRVLEAMGTNQESDDKSDPELNATSAGPGSRASAAIATHGARQIVVQGDYYAPTPPMVTMPPAPPKATPTNAGSNVSLVDAKVKIRPGHYESWRLELDEGDRVRGTVESTGEVNVLLFDEQGYADYLDEEEYDEDSVVQEDKRFIPIDFTAQDEDAWYLVVEVYGKQNPREVQVKLKKRVPIAAE